MHEPTKLIGPTGPGVSALDFWGDVLAAAGQAADHTGWALCVAATLVIV